MSAHSFANPLPGVPDVESPFFEELFAAKNASPQTMAAARSMREKGYAIIDFPDPDFDARAERIKDAMRKQFDMDRWRKELWPNNDGVRFTDAWRSNADVKAIAGNPHVIKLLGELYGRTAFPFQTLNFPVGTQQSVHSDSVHFCSMPERYMCGVWVAMEDVDEGNGALQYYPASHAFPTYVNEHVGACAAAQRNRYDQYGKFEALWAALMQKAGIAPETFHARKGQALIWSANLLHGGVRHRDGDRTRWSQVTHYFFDDCAYYTPMLSDPPLGRVFFRQLRDASTGEAHPNSYVGHRISKRVIARLWPSLMERTATGVRNRLRDAVGSSR